MSSASSHSETTPLLKQTTTTTNEPNTSATVSQTHDNDDPDRPLPLFQITLLSIARMVEPLAFFSIFPFVNKMIFEMGYEEEDVGFYSGLIESVFSLTQVFLMIVWSKAADRFGRKPILVLSLVGVGIATVLFGISKSMVELLVYRSLAGVFAGTVITVRTMITENSTMKTQARAFSLFAFAGNLGIFLGPLIGGALASPSDQYPSVFKGVWLWDNYPYLLPCLVVGILAEVMAVMELLLLKETLVRNASGKAAPSMPIKEILKAPTIPIVLFIYCTVALLGMSFTAILPVFWFTSAKLGGWGLNPLQISIFLGLAGISQSLWLLIAFPPLQNRFGTKRMLKWSSLLWIIVCLFYPLLNIALRLQWTTFFWICALVSTPISSSIAMSYTGIQLLLNEASPGPTALGVLNGIALSLTSAIRAIVPAAFASIFAEGVKRHILWGYLVWVILLVIAIMHVATVHLAPEHKAPNDVTNQRDEEEEPLIT